MPGQRAYLSDGVSAATVGELSRLGAVGGEGGDDLGGVRRGLAGSNDRRHQGGAGCNKCVLHVCWRSDAEYLEN